MAKRKKKRTKRKTTSRKPEARNSDPDSTVQHPGTTALAGAFRELNHLVFWPPFLLLLAAVVLNLVDKEKFKEVTGSLNEVVISNFGWLFVICAVLALGLCILICFLPFGRVRIGGRDAEPLMSMWNWFAITICTTVAVGILFWSTAEPIDHLFSPPSTLRLDANSPESAMFAMKTMYLHWSFTPYAIYCVASLTFAFAYYNMKKPFSLGSTLTPLLGNRVTGRTGNLIDAVCLYALVAGMAASLGTGILTISGGLNHLFDVPRTTFVWAIIAIVIVATFIVSSATGLMKGIRILSDLNAKALFGLAIVAFIAGPTLYIITFGASSAFNFLISAPQMNIFPLTADNGDSWPGTWTVFYWAVWMAWAPITACFLGRIAYGRTVREFMLVNFVFPSLFSMAWMAIFSCTAIHLQQNGTDLLAVKDASGYEAVSYAVFETFPFAVVIIGFYLTSAFICFVTSADSNTTAMAAISSTGISPENPEANLYIKVLWGVSVGTVAWVMISFADINGVKIISTLGGFPASILLLFVIASLVKILLNYKTLDATKQS
ncbi:MAG: BCCT family transporter [Planctomycetota bacterium]